MDKDLNYDMGLPYRVEVVEDKEEGFRQLEDAKRQWFTACLEDGIAVPEPVGEEEYSGQFKLRLPKSLHRLLAQLSSEEGVSMDQYCVYLLSRGV